MMRFAQRLAAAVLVVLAPGLARGQEWQPVTPNSIDLRPMLPPVRDQIFRGSCAVFAAVGAMEFHPGVPHLSEAYAYALLKEGALTLEGANFPALREFLESTPIVAAERMPYELLGLFSFNEKNPDELAIGRAFNQKRGEQARMLAPFAIYHARGVRDYTPDQIDWAWIERTLRAGQPIVMGFSMNSEHWTKAARGVIWGDTVNYADGSSRTFSPDGGHAVLAVGYRTIYDPADPGKQRTLRQILIRNSWGPDWGDQGYGWITWETYASTHLKALLTIDRVETIVGRQDQAPVLDLRVQGMKWKALNYSCAFSCIIKSNYVPEGGIESVEYTLYEGPGPLDQSAMRVPFGTQTSRDAGTGFRVVFDGLSESSCHIRMTVRYRLGGESILYFPVPEICQWSPAPDVDGFRSPAGN